MTQDYLYRIMTMLMGKQFKMNSSVMDLQNMTDEILRKIKQVSE